MNTLQGPITDEEAAKLRERNSQRAKEAIVRLGTKYLLHEDNQVRRTNDPSRAAESKGNRCI